jgi:hypothetical protein
MKMGLTGVVDKLSNDGTRVRHSAQSGDQDHYGM